MKALMVLCVLVLACGCESSGPDGGSAAPEPAVQCVSPDAGVYCLGKVPDGCGTTQGYAYSQLCDEGYIPADCQNGIIVSNVNSIVKFCCE